MLHLRSSVIMLIVSAGCVGGCSTTGDALADKASGTVQTYPVNTDQAWDISRAVFRWEGCDAIEEHKAEGYMVTSSGMGAFTWGTVMAAWVEAAPSGASTVTVVTKRRVATNLVTTLTEGTFHRRFAQAVEIVKSGKPLPLTSPGS